MDSRFHARVATPAYEAELSRQRFENTRNANLRQWYQDSQFGHGQTQRNAQIRLELQRRLRKRRSMLARTKQPQKQERQQGFITGVQRLLTGEDIMIEKKAQILAKIWANHSHSLEIILAGAEWDEPSDFGIDEGGNDSQGAGVGDQERKHSDAHDVPLHLKTIIKAPQAQQPKKKKEKVSDEEKAAAEEDVQRRFIHTRDLKLRQWYAEAHSHDPQIRLDAQVRLHIQSLLRDQRSTMEDCKSRRDFHKQQKSDTAALIAVRAELREAQKMMARMVKWTQGQEGIPKKLPKRATAWWSRGHSLEETLGGIEWDRRSEFGVFKWQTDDTVYDQQFVEADEDQIGIDEGGEGSDEDQDENEDAEQDSGPEDQDDEGEDKQNEQEKESEAGEQGEDDYEEMVSESSEEEQYEHEEIVSDSDEEGGVLLSNIYEPHP